MALASADMEVDFFANVAHLQMHRRTRALQRLTKVRLSSYHACKHHCERVELNEKAKWLGSYTISMLNCNQLRMDRNVVLA